MEFKVLGPPELCGGPRDAKLTPQLWGVLASLLMAEGRPVPVDDLADHLWGWDSSPMAAATIRTYISRINKLLALEGIRINSRRGGYQLMTDPQDVDLHRYHSLRRQAESVAESGDLDHAAALLRAADELWRGPLLMGLSGEWVAARRKALDDERHEAVKLRIRLDLNLGRQRLILGELRELSARYPFDEEIARVMAIALYRLGRQADALRAAREISERFAEAGIDPSPELREVHSQILRGDSSLGVTPAYRSPDRPQPNTLPPESPGWVGRTEETERLAADHGGNAPVFAAVVGMAGVGKSALAVHVAHLMASRYPDAQLFVPFPQQGDAGGVAEVLQRLLRMLGVPAVRIPMGADERARLWQAEIAHRRAVVVLDDVPDPEQVRLIVPVGGDSLTIATSRHRGSWPGQQVLNLEPLGDKDSVTLLRRVAGPAADQDPGKVALAASLCAGLPLAIRVAGGKLQDGDLNDLDGLIGDLRDIHAGHGDDAEYGHQIFSAFEYSYRQLTAEGRRMFRLLGGACPCADFGLDAVAALTGQDKADVADGIDALVGRCLLERGSAGRFRFHAVIRSYAAVRCRQEEPGSERRRAVGRLIQHYSDTLKAAAAADYTSPRQTGPVSGEESSQFPDPGSAHAWLEAEWRSILLTARYAAGHERLEQCADLIHSLAGFLQAAGYWAEAIPAYEAALHAGRTLADPSRAARAALDLSAAYRRTGDGEKARRYAEEALAAYSSLGNQHGQATALDQLGLVCKTLGRVRDALAYHQEAADLYREANDSCGVGRAVMRAAVSLGMLGRHADETHGLEQALGLLQEAGDQRGVAMCLNNLGAVLEDRGLHRDAVAHYEQTIAIFSETRERQNMTLLDHNLGHVKQYRGDLDKALEIFRNVLAAYCANGDQQHQAMAMSDIGNVFVSKECYSEALVHHEKSARLAESIGDRRQVAVALCGMGDAYRGSGSYGAAVDKYDEAHRLATEIEAPYINGRALFGLAETLLITQGVGPAKIYWRQAYDIFAQLGVREAATVELRLHRFSSATAS